jgi:hypothetical protein
MNNLTTSFITSLIIWATGGASQLFGRAQAGHGGTPPNSPLACLVGPHPPSRAVWRWGKSGTHPATGSVFLYRRQAASEADPLLAEIRRIEQALAPVLNPGPRLQPQTIRLEAVTAHQKAIDLAG